MTEYANDYEYNEYQDVREIGVEEKKVSDKPKKFEFFPDRGADVGKNHLRKAPRSEDTGFVSSLKIEPMVIKNSQYDEPSETPAVNRIRHEVRDSQVSPSITEKPGGQAYKKIYQNNLRKRIKNLYKDKVEKEIIGDPSQQTFSSKKDLDRIQPRIDYLKELETHTQLKVEEAKKDEKINDDLKDNSKLSKHQMTNRKRFTKFKKDILANRMTDTRLTHVVNEISEDYDDDDSTYHLDQKAVETEEKSNKIRLLTKQVKNKTKETKEKEDIKNTDQAINSFNQMRFWRNRFESDRIKTFLNSKKASIENSKAVKEHGLTEGKTVRPLQRKRMPFLKTDYEAQDAEKLEVIPFLKEEGQKEQVVKVKQMCQQMFMNVESKVAKGMHI